MSMVAIFACGDCKTESIHGRFKGEPMYEAEFVCLKCKKKTRHWFTRYQGEEFVARKVKAMSARQA